MIAIVGIVLALQPSAANIREMFEQNLARCEREYGEDDVRTAAAARDLGLYLRGQNDAQGAYAVLSRAVEVDGRIAGRDSTRTLEDVLAIASVAPPYEAEELWKRASGASDAAIASKAYGALGELRERAGDRAGAAEMYAKSLAKEEAASGKNSAETAVRLNALALVSEPGAAVPLLERALAIDRNRWGEKNPETATAESNLSGELLAMGRIAEAVRFGALALANFEATLGPDHPRTAAAASNLADAERAAGNRAAAEKLYRRALKIDETAYGKAHPETVGDAKNLAEFLREIGREADAASVERRYSVR